MKPFLLSVLLITVASADRVAPVISPQTERPWPGRDFWANPSEDWMLVDGRIENRFSGGNRNLVVLTGEIGPAREAFTLTTNVDQISFETRGEGYVGFEVGRQGDFNDYRDSAVSGSGLAVGIDFTGRPFIGSALEETSTVPMPIRNLDFEFKAEPAEGDLYRCTLRVTDATGKIVGKATTEVHGSRLEGLVALMASTQLPKPVKLTEPRPAKLPAISQLRGDEGRFAFSRVDLSGGKIVARPERAFGPILWSTYTLDNAGVLRLLIQAAPFSRNAKLEATLDLPGREQVLADLEPNSRTALFRVRNVPTDRPTEFTVTLTGTKWTGTIQPLPKSGKVTVASLSCNDATGFPHNDLVANVTAQEPDLITFHGDQIYEGIGGYGLIYDQKPNDRALLSYLRKYAMHGWTWRELLRNRPSITIPDDHDVFHGNLWGAGGKAADVSRGYGNPSQDSGGYKMSVEFVNAVHRSQAGNLPEPADPAPCRSGISVYFTRFAYGPLDIAVLSDRQFKSAPRDLLPVAEIENGWPRNLRWDAKTESSHPDAELLGPRQEAFLRRWARNPAKGTSFRLAISQSPFCAPQTLPKDIHDDTRVPSLPIYKDGEYAPDDEPKADFDTNGWPREKRDLALELMKEAKALHITGDQHLATTGQYGIEKWKDGTWWTATPATANVWPRRWMPSEPGKNRRSDDPKWLGDFTDGFGNPITLHAVANPRDIDREPARLFDRAVGYCVTTFDTSSGRITLSTWPYWASPAKAAPDNQPYPGWPIEIDPQSGQRVR
ncbi:twin-arginine translocation pathway signal protein [Haloferula helveola]|uniref:Twin-arginine translocation pathway signal protein n=1 Tax=Haloferula helveola TaxID=490095 RepID=A0ABN6H0S9_9BACT|nr:twin-arginine translocation pathway signal protein [Haloferula helveola]